MTLEQFQELAPKTVNDLTIKIPEGYVAHKSTLAANKLAGDRANLGHMSMGMAGEVLSELTIALLHRDLPNILEEVTDAKWYMVQAANFKGYVLNTFILKNHTIANPDVRFLSRLDLTWDVKALFLVNITVGTLVDVLKRESCYGKPKYQGVEVTEEQYKILFYDAMKALDMLLDHVDLDPEYGYERVIEKLHKVRYAKADGSIVFSEEAATSRNLTVEKSVIEGGQ